MIYSFIIALIGLVSGYFIGGIDAVIIVFFLSIMEVSLSFDNAVVNAVVLKKMTPIWQRRFLTWGILIAVFGMRLLFPALIVSITGNINIIQVVQIALYQPELYQALVIDAHNMIALFGGTFLLMLFTDFLLDEKDVYWLEFIESNLIKLNKINNLSSIIALVFLLVMTAFINDLYALCAGIIGICTYLFIKGLSNLFDIESNIKSGIIGFLYLELLDMSFSLDGVIGAFALSNNIIIIMIGLAIGAVFVRSLTVWLVKNDTLDQYIYLEHGAYYSIGILAIIMLISPIYEVSQIITGLIGVTLIGISFLNSLRYNAINSRISSKLNKSI